MVTWRVQNFKSLRQAELELSRSHLTVIAGANSSGKSSLLQSLLLLAQSSYRLGPVILNGPLARLGDPTELIRGGQKSMSLAYEFSRESRRSDGITASESLIVTLEPMAGIEELQVTDLAMASTKNDGGLEPWLRATKKRVKRQDLDDSRSVLDASLPSTLLRLYEAGSVKVAPRTYVALEGIFPAAVIQHRNEEWISRKYSKLLRAALGQDISSIRYDRTVIVEFVDLVRRGSVREGLTLSEGLDQLISDSAVNPFRFLSRWQRLTSEQQTLAIDLASRERCLSPWIMISLDLGRYGAYTSSYRSKAIGLLEAGLEEELAEVVQSLSAIRRDLLQTASRINYLGPLRDEPKVVWESWHERSQGLPVGLRGEQSAGILARNGNQVISFNDPEKKKRSGTLLVAVSVWSKYLGIGDSVSSKDRGKLGSGIELSVGGHNRDLTTVGVGVSQLLPIIVGLLSLRPGDHFLVEQPELHLHPAVQSRLADFLLFARQDVSVTVETHSEALLTRVRMRVAQQELDPSRVTVLFVESADSGATTTSLDIDDYGDMARWPSGFFDAGQNDSMAILRANALRMKAKSRA